MIIKKRQLMLATLVAVLAAAVFVNWYYTRPEAETAQSSNLLTTSTSVERDAANLGDARYVISSDVAVEENDEKSEFFSNAKQRRNNARDEAFKALNDVIKDSASSPEAVSSATKTLEKIAESVALESDLENLIYAKVGCENIAIINAGKAEIVVESGFLDEITVTKIKETVINQTGLSAENITIVETKY